MSSYYPSVLTNKYEKNSNQYAHSIRVSENGDFDEYQECRISNWSPSSSAGSLASEPPPVLPKDVLCNARRSQIKLSNSKMKKHHEKPLPEIPKGSTTFDRKQYFAPLNWHEKSKYKIAAFFTNDSSRFMVMTIYISFCALVFTLKYKEYSSNIGIYKIFGPFLGIARGSASIIKFNSSLILLTICRTILTKLRSSIFATVIPFDNATAFHKFIGFVTVLFASIHVLAHNLNYLSISHKSVASSTTPLYLLTNTVPGYTGIVLILIFFIAGTASFQKVRQLHFEIFYYSHWLWFLFFVISVPHGMTCFIGKYLNLQTKCLPGGEFWIWSFIGILAILTEKLILRLFYRAARPIKILAVIKRPSNVLEISMEIPNHFGGRDLAYKSTPGMYVFLNCPKVSMFQYHPFTLSSAPSEGIFTVNIRCTGNWTVKFAKECGVDFKSSEDKKVKLPDLYVDGPFGTSSNDVFNFEIALLCGSGIGITPFSSIIKELYIRYKEERIHFKKVYLFWICREPASFSWFIEILREIQDCDAIETFIYLTGNIELDQLNLLDSSNDIITGLKSPTFFGKPHWRSIFNVLADNHPKSDIGIFTCAPPKLCAELSELSAEFTLKSRSSTAFHFHKENF
eukprot:NODE_527_length_7199_cov_0.216197.p2 type:complete len:625 gc:universal NODE_527_length_7199_cov_0.216197:209-2083(+)